jgi:hypothetical protein
MLPNGEKKMPDYTAYAFEKNKNLARQMESLRGLRFRRKGDQDAQYMVLSTEVTANGDVYVTGLCTGGLVDEDHGIMANGQVFRFYINEICLTLDALDALESRISEEYRS